jgi:hypothetical protein
VLIKSVLESIQCTGIQLRQYLKEYLIKFAGYAFISYGQDKSSRGYPPSIMAIHCDSKGSRGWGLKDIHSFTRALAGQNLWRMTQGNSLWTRVMNSKYFPNLSVVEWFRITGQVLQRLHSMESLGGSFPTGRNWTVWQIGNGRKVRLGEDPWLGVGDNYRLPPPPPLSINFLRENNLLSRKDVSIGYPQLRGTTRMEGCAHSRPSRSPDRGMGRLCQTPSTKISSHWTKSMRTLFAGPRTPRRKL